MDEFPEQDLLALALPLRPRPRNCAVPLTPVQLMAWTYLEDSRQSTSRTAVTSVRLLGPLDTGALERSVEIVVRRHESLRTRFVAMGGTPRQAIDADCRGHFRLTDVSKQPSAIVENHVKRLAEEFLEEKVDVSRGPLFVAQLFKLSLREHVLILAVDHMISDYDSLQILARELVTAYHFTAQKQPVQLPRVTLQFADYAVWQSQLSPVLRRMHESYWKQRLSGVPQVKLPMPDGLPGSGQAAAEILEVTFGASLSARLHEVARRQRTLVSLAVLAVYSAFMSRWCHERDLHIAFVSNGRSRRELIDMIGLLALHFHLRIEIGTEDNFLDLVERVNQEFLSATQHPELWLVPEVAAENRTDLYFNWVSHLPPGASDAGHPANGNISITAYPCYRKALPFVLGSFFMDTPGGIVCTIEYRPDVFTPATLEWVGRAMRSFAQEMVERPLARLATLPMAT